MSDDKHLDKYIKIKKDESFKYFKNFVLFAILSLMWMPVINYIDNFFPVVVSFFIFVLAAYSFIKYVGLEIELMEIEKLKKRRG